MRRAPVAVSAREPSRARAWAGAAGLAASLAAALASCGGRTPRSTLAAAGTDGDDGAGQLAAASAQVLMGGDGSDGFAPEHRDLTRDEALYGAGYGGGAYGGGAYGGYLYGGYSPYAPGVNPPAGSGAPYMAIVAPDAGAITGTVRWPRPPAAPAVLATACGDLPNPTLAIGRGAAVADTVVYLARIDHGRAAPVASRSVQVGGQLERRGCAFQPTVQVVTPVPSTLAIVNGEAASLVVVAGAPGKEVRLPLDEGASRTTPLGAGAIRVADDGGALVPAWVIAVPHPYYALTDADGQFRLDDVPPGSYELVVWHAPVVTGVRDGKIVAAAPVEVRRDVVVKAMNATSIAIELPATR